MVVELFVDGKKIGLNRFVETMLGNILVGVVSSLRGVGDDWRRVEMRFVRGENG